MDATKKPSSREKRWSVEIKNIVVESKAGPTEVGIDACFKVAGLIFDVFKKRRVAPEVAYAVVKNLQYLLEGAFGTRLHGPADREAVLAVAATLAEGLNVYFEKPHEVPSDSGVERGDPEKIYG